MKTNIFKTLLWLPLVICGLTFSACGGDDEEEENGGGEVNLLARHLKVKNVSAHYVGDAVIVDFQLENKSDKNINDLSLYVEGTDNNSIWYHFDENFISTGEGQPFMDYMSNLTFAAHETRNMRACFTGSTLQVGVNRFTVKLLGGSAQMGMTGSYQSISFTTDVTDNRVSQNAIWTNDDHMSYGKPTARRSGDNLFLSFTVTNNTGIDLPNSKVSISHLDNGNGREFYYPYLYIDDATKEANYEISFTTNASETRTLTIYVPDFYKNPAKCVNATLMMSSNYYYFACKYLFLVSIEL